jgi:hypothetical protein
MTFLVNVRTAQLFFNKPEKYTIPYLVLIIIVIIIIIIVINCNWVLTQWQWLFYMYKNMEGGE